MLDALVTYVVVGLVAAVTFPVAVFVGFYVRRAYMEWFDGR